MLTGFNIKVIAVTIICSIASSFSPFDCILASLRSLKYNIKCDPFPVLTFRKNITTNRIIRNGSHDVKILMKERSITSVILSLIKPHAYYK